MTTEAKRAYLKEAIIDRGFNANDFAQFIEKQKVDGSTNL